MSIKTNDNELAKELTQWEGKKIELPIAQIKEVLCAIKAVMSDWTDEEIIKCIRKKRRTKK